MLSAVATIACGGGAAERASAEWESVTTTEGDVTTVRTLAGSIWDGAARLVEEASIGVAIGEDPYMFGRIDDIAASDAEIYVVDGDVPAIRVYGMDGTYRRDIGSAGQGPGEFSAPNNVAIADDGTVYVHDGGGDRVTLFTAEGELIETWAPRQQGNFTFRGMSAVLAHDGTFYTQGRVADPDSDSGGQRMIVSLSALRMGMFPRGPEGAAGDPIEVPSFDHETPSLQVRMTAGDNVMLMVQPVPFMPGVHWGMSPTGAIVAGVATDYRYEIRYPDGSATIVEKAWEPLPVDPEEAAWRRAFITAQIRETAPEWVWEGPEIPATRPAYDGLYPDDSGRVWVRRTGPAIEDPECDPDPLVADEMGKPCWRSETIVEVFDLEGAFLGVVHWPDEITLDRRAVIRGDMVLAAGEDQEGTRFVNRYRLEIPGASD